MFWLLINLHYGRAWDGSFNWELSSRPRSAGRSVVKTENQQLIKGGDANLRSWQFARGTVKKLLKIQKNSHTFILWNRSVDLEIDWWTNRNVLSALDCVLSWGTRTERPYPTYLRCLHQFAWIDYFNSSKYLFRIVSWFSLYTPRKKTILSSNIHVLMYIKESFTKKWYRPISVY